MRASVCARSARARPRTSQSPPQGELAPLVRRRRVVVAVAVATVVAVDMSLLLVGFVCSTFVAGPSSASVDCDSITTKSACDQSGCSWCLAGAVPPSCKTIDEAKSLPPAVFQCDHLDPAQNASVAPCNEHPERCATLKGALPGSSMMPLIALGTWRGSYKDCAKNDFACVRARAKTSVSSWLKLSGGTHIDGANNYRTQVEIAEALRAGTFRRK